jgi:hypothetical protein
MSAFAIIVLFMLLVICFAILVSEDDTTNWAMRFGLGLTIVLLTGIIVTIVFMRN